LARRAFEKSAQDDINAIPYKGGAGAINDLLGGQIPMSFTTAESGWAVGAGSLRALAVTTASRAPFLPDVRSMADFGRLRHRSVVGLARGRRHAARIGEKLSHDFVAA